MTETDPKPEVLVTPYEPEGPPPNDPLPGVAPEMRRDAGGFWRAEAGRDGEPDWRAEVRAIDAVLGNRSAFDDCHTRAEKVAKAIREAIVSGELRVDVRTLTAERDALRAEVERLKGDVAAIQSRCPEAVEAMSDRGLLAAGSPYSPEVEAKVKARALDVLVSMTTDDLSEDARETSGNTPPTRNDAPDVAGEGPAPVEAPVPNAAAESTSYFHAGNITACHPTFAAGFPDLAAAMVPPDGACRCSMWPEPHIHSTLSAAPSRIGPAPVEAQGGGQAVRILDLVKADLDARAEKGRQTYGDYLRADSPNDALWFLYEEWLDGIKYLRQEIERRKVAQQAPQVIAPLASQTPEMTDGAAQNGAETGDLVIAPSARRKDGAR